MAPESITQERIYNAIKGDYLDGLYRPGARIDLHSIADRHRASTTPVREAIHRLIGEQLFEPHIDGGFQIALPDPLRLGHLYTWYCQQLLGALHMLHETALARALEPFREGDIVEGNLRQAQRTAMIFQAIASATNNLEIAQHISRANERLHYPRLAENNLITRVGQDLRNLTRNGHTSGISNIRRRIMAYHDRRIQQAADIIAGMQHLASPPT